MAACAGFSDELDTRRIREKTNQTTYECPVCTEYLLPPIYQCFNGHTFCKECEPKMTKCPVCRDDMPQNRKIRNLILEDIVVGCLFDCKHFDEGCDVSLKYHEIEGHAWDCPYTELSICSHLGIKCEAKQSLKTIVQHLKTFHAVLGINCEELSPIKGKNKDETFSISNESIPIEISQSASLFRLEKSKEILWKPHYFQFCGQVFFLKTTVDTKEKTCMWTVFALGSKKLTKQFLAKIKLLPKDSGMACIKWQGQVSELKNEQPVKNAVGDITSSSSSLVKTSSSADILNLSIPIQKLNLLCKTKSKTQARQALNSNPQQVKDKEAQKLNEDFLQWRVHVQLIQVKEDEDEKKFAWNPKPVAVVIDSEVSYDGHIIVQNSSNGIRGKPGVWIQKDFAEKVQLPQPEHGYIVRPDNSDLLSMELPTSSGFTTTSSSNLTALIKSPFQNQFLSLNVGRTRNLGPAEGQGSSQGQNESQSQSQSQTPTPTQSQSQSQSQSRDRDRDQDPVRTPSQFFQTASGDFMQSLVRQPRTPNENRGQVYNSFTGFYEEPAEPTPVKSGYVYFQD